MLLTQSTTPIIGWIAILLGYVMEFIFYVLDSVGIQNIGLCIIIFTIFVRMIMLPLTIKQQKFSKISQVMQPEITKVQKKYRNKKDQASMAKQQEEIQKVYDKYGTSPTGGCLQLVVQMPIFFALYQVIRKIPAYIPQVKASYMTAVKALENTPGYLDKINTVAAQLNSSYVKELSTKATSNDIIDVLNYFTQSAWTDLANAFPSVADTINHVSTSIIHMNDFMFGINVAQTPGFKPSVYWVIAILAALFQYLSTKTMQQPNMDDSNPAAGMTKSMTWMMPLMSLYFCLVMPAGLGLYWVTSALFQCIQQVVINRYMDGVDMDVLIEKNIKKAEKKRAKGRKSLMERLTATSSKANEAKESYENANYNDVPRTISSIASINTKKIQTPAGVNSEDYSDYDTADIDNMGEIGKNAYLVAKYEKEHTKGGKK